MFTVPRQVKWLTAVAVYLAVTTVGGMKAEAAFHLQRADDSPPAAGLFVEGLRTAPIQALPAPEPAQPRLRAPTRFPEAVQAPSRVNDSTNRFVDPWGCEARHAQQWSPSGRYWGKYQFDRQTWAAHGGSSGSYGSASEAEQDRVASRVRYDAWPNC